jgi:hypothetical protein
MTGESGEERKIIVDEDWKSRVEAERDAHKQADSTHDPTAPGTENREPEQLPPASFSFLVTTLATQAMATLGQIPDPIEQKPVVRLELAKHHIDSLVMLQEKTKGNLTSEENQLIDEVIHQLRMLFVHIQTQGNAPGP